MDHSEITEADIAQARADPRFKQILLARVLEQLLGALYRAQQGASDGDEANACDLRAGAIVAIQLADVIRSIDERLRLSPGTR